ncbi:MAG: hypothetical protein V6Z86_00245 [Hyphomicrobiales bacterium]
MMPETSVMSKSDMVLRTERSSSCTPTSMTKVRGGTRWPEAINSPRRTWSATLSKTSRRPFLSPRLGVAVTPKMRASGLASRTRSMMRP